VLPVIGVPVASEQMSGTQALYVTAQMPAGVPAAASGGGGAPVGHTRLWQFKEDLAEGLRL
jgi:phosphoribosylcarboxyaminoimidazole (NCAIR) mutase